MPWNIFSRKNQKLLKQMEKIQNQLDNMGEGVTLLDKRFNEIKHEVSVIKEQVLESNEQVAKNSRLQYKTSSDIIKKLESLNQNIEENTIYKDKYEYELKQQKILSDKLFYLIEILINLLDSIDIACDRNPDEKHDNWYNLHKSWQKQIIENLYKIGVVELNILGKRFDPMFAEAVDSISAEQIMNIDKAVSKENFEPFEVVKVVRRGFITRDGKLLRKAQVITIKEEERKNE